MKRAYLDNAASTPMDPAVCDAIAGALSLHANPSAMHTDGMEVRKAVDGARKAVANLLRVAPTELVFTSGATEANALAIIGAYRAAVAAGDGSPKTVITSAIEHASVRSACDTLAREGAEIITVGVDENSVIDIRALKAVIDGSTVLVTTMWANNITGTIQPVAEIGEMITKERERRGSGGLPIVFHTDAVQAVRTEDVLPDRADVDLLSCSAHKIYGPKGAGALYVRRGVRIIPIVKGGGHEHGLRGGTENVLGIVGFGAAADVLDAQRSADREHDLALRKRLVEGSGDIVPFGERAEHVPGIVYCTGLDKDADEMVLRMDMAGIAVSAGSACDAGTRKEFAVTGALGRSAAGGIRISFGRFTTEQEIDRIIEALAKK